MRRVKIYLFVVLALLSAPGAGAADCRRRVGRARRRTSRHLFRWDARRARYEARD